MEMNTIGNKITITGNIKSISHYNEIRSIIDEILINQKNIVVKLMDSISVTSSVIGYFSKLINVDGVVLELFVNDDDLFNLLEDLGLTQAFNVQRLHHDN